MGVFDDIYKGNGWGFGSGHGSLPRVTKGYRAYIELFLRENDIKTVVDLGCGDWQFSRLINWGDVQYTGLDIVPSVVEEDQKKFGKANINFKLIKAGQTDLPKADLIIVKDVLQHMSTAAVQEFVKKALPRYKFALITNCSEPANDLNIEIEEGGFRPLDLRAKPYNVKGAAVYAFSGPKTFSRSARKFFPAWKKQVVLFTNER
jgi:SAM-dependent methyltransferase